MSSEHPVAMALKPYIAGGSAAVIATMCVHPVDLLKTRVQMQVVGAGEARVGSLKMARSIISEGGVTKLYAGLSAAVMRQAVYGTVRLGLHDQISNTLKDRNGGHAIPLYQKIASSMISGAVGGLAGNPFDIAMVRMQADGQAPVEQRRGYTNVFTAVGRIVKEEGLMTLWRGSIPMVCRAIAMNVGMLASYDQSKELLAPYTGTGKTTSLLASAISGFVCAFTTLPFDLIKCRLMNMRVDPATGAFPYKNLVDCTCKIFKQEGIMQFWRGYWTFYARSAPHAMISLLMKDVLNSWYDKAFL